MPEAFLAADEILRTSTRLVRGLQLHEPAIARNLAAYGPFAATEALLMELVRAGGSRQVWHERLREHAQAAWAEVQAGGANPLIERLRADHELVALVPPERIDELLDLRRYLGDAPERCRAFVADLRNALR